MFELESLTKVKVLDVRTLASKDRKPDELPGAQLLLQATLGSNVLAMFDGFLPGLLYRKPVTKKQGEIEGFETAELTSVGEHVKRLPWVYEQTGCEVTIDLGMGGRSNIVLPDTKVHRVSMRPEQNGVVIQWTVDALGLNDTTRGKLTGLKRTDVQMLLVGPEVEGDGQQDIERTPAPRPARKAAAATSGSSPANEAGKADTANAGEASKSALDAGGKNPFGATPAPAPAPGSATDAFIEANKLGQATGTTLPDGGTKAAPASRRPRRDSATEVH